MRAAPDQYAAAVRDAERALLAAMAYGNAAIDRARAMLTPRDLARALVRGEGRLEIPADSDGCTGGGR
jgi:hypothetical protein